MGLKFSGSFSQRLSKKAGKKALNLFAFTIEKPQNLTFFFLILDRETAEQMAELNYKQKEENSRLQEQLQGAHDSIIEKTKTILAAQVSKKSS